MNHKRETAKVLGRNMMFMREGRKYQKMIVARARIKIEASEGFENYERTRRSAPRAGRMRGLPCNCQTARSEPVKNQD